MDLKRNIEYFEAAASLASRISISRWRLCDFDGGNFYSASDGRGWRQWDRIQPLPISFSPCDRIITSTTSLAQPKTNPAQSRSFTLCGGSWYLSRRTLCHLD